jgi:hypothetical protein
VPDKNRNTGRVDAVWPGSALHYMELIKTPRYEDFDIKHHHKVWLSTILKGYGMIEG